MNTDAGYVRDVAYPPHFHKEMQPVWLASVAHIQGTPAPELGKPYSYCELGCGMGINLLVAAACNPLGQFVGVDFNERHLAFAQKAAQFIGLDNIRFEHGDFAHFSQRNEQAFDFIASHGVWSWIAAEQQAQVLQLLEGSLKPQGLFYLHYMCHPGATQMIPLQKLLNDLAAQQPGNSEQKIRAGLELLGRLDASGAFHDQPRLRASLQALQAMNAAYLAHHFLSDHWAPLHSVDVHATLARAGLSYLGSANLFDNLDGLSIPGAAQAILPGLPSAALRETVKDIARNQHQRQDLFQRQPIRLSAQEHLRRVSAMVFRLSADAPRTGGLNFSTPIGQIQGPAALFSPLLERLGEGPASFAELQRLPAFKDNLGLLAQSLQMLMWHGSIHPLRSDATDCDKTAERLQLWTERHGLHLQAMADCGTASLRR